MGSQKKILQNLSMFLCPFVDRVNFFAHSENMVALSGTHVLTNMHWENWSVVKN